MSTRPPALPADLKAPQNAGAYPTEVFTLLGRHAGPTVDAATVFAAGRQVLLRDRRFAGSARQGLLRPLWRTRPAAEALTRLAALPTKARKQLLKVVTDDLVGLAARPTARLAPLGVGGPVLAQRAGHLVAVRREGRTVYSVRAGTTLSSEAAKRDTLGVNGHLREHLAQAHAVTLGGRLVAFRSARADTPAKMRAKLTQAAIAALEAAGGDPSRATGWRQVDGAWRFSPTLVSAMDRSILKHIFESVMWLFGGERPEGARLGDLAASVDSLFRAGRGLTVDVRAAGGAPLTVTLAPPRVLNVILSGQSNSPSNLRRTRRANRPAMQGLAADLGRAWAGSSDPARRRAGQVLARAKHLGDLRRRIAKVASSSLWRNLDTEGRLAVDALALGLSGATTGGHRLLDAAHPGHELLLDQALVHESGGAYLLECKSGIDRTGTATALAAAAATLSASGRPFDPLDPRVDAGEMRSLFTRAADALNADIVRLTRSASGRIKWRGRATPMAWYAPTADSRDPLGILS